MPGGERPYAGGIPAGGNVAFVIGGRQRTARPHELEARGMVRIRLFAALRDAAGTAEVELPPAELGDLLDELGERFGARFTAVLGHASVMVDGRRLADRGAKVPDGSELALLPPFSGGA